MAQVFKRAKCQSVYGLPIDFFTVIYSVYLYVFFSQYIKSSTVVTSDNCLCKLPKQYYEKLKLNPSINYSESFCFGNNFVISIVTLHVFKHKRATRLEIFSSLFFIQQSVLTIYRIRTIHLIDFTERTMTFKALSSKLKI